MQTTVAPAFAEADSSNHAQRPDPLPDFDSAVLVESNSDYQITEDGYLIYEGDTVFECRALRDEEGGSIEAYKERVRICTQEGFRPPGSLPDTGGPPVLPMFLALLLCCSSLCGAVASWRRMGWRDGCAREPHVVVDFLEPPRDEVRKTRIHPPDGPGHRGWFPSTG
jgi:hypothetical protein